jgi:tRNA (guanine10-N2)-dimethyltransferase
MTYMRMRLLFLLSGEHPTLPFSELSCVGRITDRQPQVAVVDCISPVPAHRLAMAHSVMEYLGDCPADPGSLVNLLKDLSLTAFKPFVARASRIAGTSMKERGTALERLMCKNIAGTVSLDNPGEEYRVICSGDRCYLGKVLFHPDRGAYDMRKPGSRPFFHPGVMMPRMARTLVNMSLAGPGEWLLDPFCGTGGILIEAEEIGANPSGGDMDIMMVRGTRTNAPDAHCMLSDARSLPVKNHSVDAVVTDLPYGQSVSIMASGMESLYLHALLEVKRVLKPGRRAVIVTHRDIRETCSMVMNICEFHEQRVHKSLTRRIMVLTA